MSATRQGSFEMKYHHIEAPTIQSDSFWKKHELRKLCSSSDDETFGPLEYVYNPNATGFYRSSELFHLSDAPWFYKRKLDGENLRVYWDGEQALWNGKSNNFSCKSTLVEYMNVTFIEEIFEEKFGRNVEVYLFGEHMGNKVQKNDLLLGKDTQHLFVLYDVMVNGVWLQPENIIEVATYFRIKTCYDFMGGVVRRDEYVEELFDLIQMCEEGVFAGWEGIVAEPVCGVRDRMGKRIIVKIKNRDYFDPIQKARRG